MSDPTDTRVIDRLERLAEHAPVRRDDADLLWTRGRRRQRTRWAAVAASAAVVAVIGALIVPSALVQVRPPLAAAADGFVLPDVVREPGAWEPAFPAAPGRLSAVGIGSRSGLWSSSGWPWGVSATTGESRFLDLPGAVAFAGEPQLSADGWRLAYWVTGDVAKGPIPGTGDRPVVGIAVLDLASGDVTRWEIDSDHGLSGTGAAWAGDVLWWSAGPLRRVGTAAVGSKVDAHTWNTVTGERLDLGDGPGGGLYVEEGVGAAPEGFVVRSDNWRVRRVVADAPPTVLRLEEPPGTDARADVDGPSMSPDGDRLAALLMPEASTYDGAPMQLLTGTVDGTRVVLEAVGDVEAQGVLGWRSATEVVVSQEGSTVTRAAVVDVATGEAQPLLEFSGSIPVSLAADLWTGDVVAAPDAPFAPDPRLVVLGGGVVIVFLLSLWRSVRGRRGHP